MFVRTTIMIMRLCVLIVLILGILFWTDVAGGPLILLHMGLGILIRTTKRIGIRYFPCKVFVRENLLI